MRGYIANMATIPRIGQHRNARLYVDQHIEASGLSDDTIANRIGVSRQTVFRWRKGDRKANLHALGDALGVEPEAFYRPPRPKDAPPKVSLDEIVKDYPDDLRAKALEIVRLLGKTG